MKKLIFLFGILFYVSGIDAQVTLKGAEIPGTLTLRNDSVTHELVLNGAGIRNKYFIDVYVGALYLLEKNTNDKKIIDADQPMAVRMHIISGELTMERMAEAIREGFDRSLMGRTSKYRTQIDMIVDIFKSEPVKVGDVFDIFYTPGKGVTAKKNGIDYQILIPGLAFKKALMGIWLCPNPVDENLKQGMLGLKKN